MEHNQSQQHNFEKDLLDKINSGEVKMRPKMYFILKVVLLVIIALFVLVTSVVLVSYMIFSIKVSGRLFLLGFGGRGLLAFFITFPWFILLADILFLFLFERLLNHFKFGYRSPLLYTLGASTLIIIAGGVILDQTSVHDSLFQDAQAHRLGPIGGLYMDVRRPPHEEGVFRGIVIATTSLNAGSSQGSAPVTYSFVMRSDDEDNDDEANMNATDTIWTVILPPSGLITIGSSTETQQGSTTEGVATTSNININAIANASSTTFFFTPGDVVIVAGDVSNNIIHAYGIRKILATDEQ